MKYRAAQRIKRDRDRVLAELVGLDTEAKAYKEFIDAEWATAAKCDAKITEAATAAGKFRECIGETQREAEEAIRRIRDKERAEVELHEASIADLRDRMESFQALRGQAAGRRANAEGGLAGVEPRRDSLLRELVKINAQLPEADEKIKLVESSKAPCARCKGAKVVPVALCGDPKHAAAEGHECGDRIEACPVCCAPNVVKAPSAGNFMAHRMNHGGSTPRHRPRNFPQPNIRRTVEVVIPPTVAAAPPTVANPPVPSVTPDAAAVPAEAKASP